MEWLETLVLVVHVLVSVGLIGMVLIQQGKGADAGAAFGAGGSGTVFGSAGSTSFLVKMTSWLAIGFFVIAFGLAYTAKERAGSLSELGIPKVTAPLSGLDDEASDSAADSDVPSIDIDVPSVDDLPTEIDSSVLTDEVESVNSDIPDV